MPFFMTLASATRMQRNREHGHAPITTKSLVRGFTDVCGGDCDAEESEKERENRNGCSAATRLRLTARAVSIIFSTRMNSDLIKFAALGAAAASIVCFRRWLHQDNTESDTGAGTVVFEAKTLRDYITAVFRHFRIDVRLV